MPTIAKTKIVSDLVPMALRGLAELYDPQSHLFVYQIKDGLRIRTHVHQTFVYSAITALGLRRSRQHGWKDIPADETQVIAATVKLIDQRQRPGDIGLLLWADAIVGPAHSDSLLKDVGQLVQTSTIDSMSTMELAWLLTGLCYLPTDTPRAAEIEQWARSLSQAIRRRHRQATGLFAHRTGGAWPASVRNEIGNFADQIYATYALTAFHERFDHVEALACAVRCARRLCALQGPLGQWWWHYHSRHGFVAAKYPVYGVHQDGMAPMALIKLARLSGEDFSESIGRGLNWLFGANELGTAMVEWDHGIVWREIQLQTSVLPLRYGAMAAAQLGLSGVTELFNSTSLLQRNDEMFSYHLGWLLYAFADARSRHILGGSPESTMMPSRSSVATEY
jgi:hypothetical protein